MALSKWLWQVLYHRRLGNQNLRLLLKDVLEKEAVTQPPPPTTQSSSLFEV